MKQRKVLSLSAFLLLLAFISLHAADDKGPRQYMPIPFCSSSSSDSDEDSSGLHVMTSMGVQRGSGPSSQCFEGPINQSEIHAPESSSAKKQRSRSYDALADRVARLEDLVTSLTTHIQLSSIGMKIQKGKNDAMIEGIKCAMLNSTKYAVRGDNLSNIEDLAISNIKALQAMGFSYDDFTVQSICVMAAERYYHDMNFIRQSEEEKLSLRNSALFWFSRIDPAHVSDYIRDAYDLLKKALIGEESTVDFFLGQSGLI